MRKKKNDPAGADLMQQVIAGTCRDPHAYLGMHNVEGAGVEVRVYDPTADRIVLTAGGKTFEMEKIHPAGMFRVRFPRRKNHFNYTLEYHHGADVFVSEDPYHFMPQIGEMDLYLFNQGEHRRVFDVMGAHVRRPGGVEGVGFTVWAPNAERVSVVGSFNCWDGRRHPMRLMGNSGIWELFIPGLKPGDLYKYEIRTKNGDLLTKLDPYAQQTELRPGNAGIVPQESEFDWHDRKWLEKRSRSNVQEQPLNIYEVHLGSWGGPGLPERKSPDDPFPNYREIAHALADYVLKMGYTHVELLPICEHPLDQSWGYQVTGFYAPTSRFGTPEDFAYFVDHMHRNGIGVILDWVPAHFPKDAFCFGRFDGTALYEHADPRQGEQLDWGTYVFNYGRAEVRCFLLGSAFYWLDKFHVDGLRVDAVASMLYLDYSRKPGEWIPNKYGGNENLEAIDFLKHLNELTHKLYPGIMMVAEESTSWPGVSKPLYCGGLGFTFKWNMGWMHDTLDYFEKDPIYRIYHHGMLTFSLHYAYSENFVLPLSHDEVVHGKRSIIGRMPGDYESQFANLRALYVWMMTHPGKKLLFMGGEFGQMIEWNCNQSLDWLLLDYPKHKGMQTMLADLNKFYKETPSLWNNDFSPAGFQWIDGGNVQQSIVSYVRWDKEKKVPYLVILNLTPAVPEDFRIGVPLPGKWQEVFNSDRHEYGGTGILNWNPIETEEVPAHGQAQSLRIGKLPWLSGIVLKYCGK